MAELLENWILQQLGFIIKINASTIGKHFQDGVLFKKLLQAYGILSECCTMPLEHSSYFKVCKNNLLQLCPYFRLLNMECDEDTISNIATGNGFTIIRILYEMYICFENRKHIYFITSQAERKVLKHNVPSKYDVRSKKFSEVLSDHKITEENIAYPLVQHKHITDWYKEKYKQIKLRIEEGKQAVKVHSFSKSDFIQPKYSKPKRILECETLNLPEVSSIKDTPVGSLHKQDDSLISYDDYMHSIKLRKNETKLYKCFVNNMENLLLENMWSKILCTQEEEFNKNFSDTLLKQSQYEKCMATKLFQIQHSSILQNENRKQVTSLLQKVTEAKCEMKADFDNAKCIYNDEKFRILDLHNKLYAEKLKRRYSRHYGTCLETLDAIINMVVEKYNFEQKNNCSVPLSLWNDWKQMFFNLKPFHESEVEIPLIADIDNHEEILLNKFCSESVLNDHDIDEYLRFSGEWITESISTIIGKPMGKQIILGFIVHRLLESKYPPPVAPQPANLPQMITKAILLNLYDKDAQEKLRALLIKPAVCIFDLHTVINHCLETYAKELKSLDVQEEEKNKSSHTKSLEKKQTKKSKKQSKTKKSNNDISEKVNDTKTENPNDKETQTTCFVEEMEADLIEQHTSLGLHGKHLAELLNSGNNIPDSLAVTVIIEYIKSFSNISGWVLLDFPITVDQASALELALTGTSFLVCNEETDKSNKLPESSNGINQSHAVNGRFSKLVPYPKQMERTQTYKTYFTTFIKLIDTKTSVHKSSTFENSDIKESDISDTNKELQNHKSLKESNQNEIFRDKSFISMDSWQNNQQSLQSIYSKQGIYHEFNYTTFDLETLKNLARLLLGEESKPDCRTSVDLFGQEVLDKLTSPLKGPKNKISTKHKKETLKSNVATKRYKNKDLKPSNITEELPKQTDVSLISDRNSEKNVLDVQESQSIPTKIETKSSVAPGDDEWEYSMYIIPESLLVSLATIWENTEVSYLGNMKNLFFIKRTLNSRLIPYISFIRQTITELINMPDNRQNIVSLFQDMFNSVDTDLRQHTEQKQQLHCKVFELQQQLWKLCDTKKSNVEQKVINLIQENWATNEMCNLTNTYLRMIQTEMNRCINTLKLLYDYYLAMLGKNPLETNIVPGVISNIDIKLLSEKMDRKGNYLTLEKSISSRMFDILRSSDYDGNTILNPFHEIIEKTIESTRSKVEALKKHLKNIMQKEENETITNMKEHYKNKGKEISNSESSPLQNVVLKQNLFVEWEAVMNQEIHRVINRLYLIKHRALKDLTLWQEEIQTTFNGSFNSVLNRYNAEIDSVNNLCKMLQSAIEDETPIQEKLVLIKDKFYVDVNDLLFFTPLVHEFQDLEEQILDFQFTIEQLDNLLKIMQYVSPKGIISISPFVYILHDIIHQNTIYNKQFLPKMWNNLKLSEIESIIKKIACSSLHIDWKDFLIFCLDLGFPDLQEILEERLQFLSCDPEKTEMTSLEKYNAVIFWFEKDLPKNPETALRIVRAKEFLYKLFQVNKAQMNYTAFLLYFCKDTDPRVGFGKALALALGKGIILCKKYLYLEEKTDSIVIKEILSDVIENVIQSVAGVVIKEISVLCVNDNSTETSVEKIPSQTNSMSAEEEHKSESLKHLSECIEPTDYSDDTEILLYKTSTDSSSSAVQHCDECDISFKIDFSDNIQWVSRIPVETVLAVLTSTVFKTKLCSSDLYLEEILSNINEVYDSQDGCIPAHILINLECMNKLFSEVPNFQTISVSEEILKLMTTY